MSNVETIRALYEAFGKGDVETVLAAMDPKITWREAEGHPYQAVGDVWIGPNEIVEKLFARLGTDWEDFTVSPATFTDAGNRVVVEGRYRGKYRDSNNSLDSQFCHVWDIAEGKLTAFQQYTDTAQFQKAMAVPAS